MSSPRPPNSSWARPPASPSPWCETTRTEREPEQDATCLWSRGGTCFGRDSTNFKKNCNNFKKNSVNHVKKPCLALTIEEIVLSIRGMEVGRTTRHTGVGLPDPLHRHHCDAHGRTSLLFEIEACFYLSGGSLSV